MPQWGSELTTAFTEMTTVCINPPLYQLPALQTWMARTDTGPSLVHFPMSLLFPCSRTGSTGQTGTHTQWRRPTSTLANSAQSWAITHTGRMTFTSTTRIGSLAVCTFELQTFIYTYFCFELSPRIDQYVIFNSFISQVKTPAPPII